jgi:hypothetical protein
MRGSIKERGKNSPKDKGPGQKKICPRKKKETDSKKTVKMMWPVQPPKRAYSI